MEETDENYVPEEAEEAAMQILPEKSRNAYDKEFKMFESWINSRKINEEDPTAPSDVRLIDWQISKTASPALDLVYFFLVHSPKEILYDYESYLKVYYATLSKNLREFSCEAEKVFPYSTLLQHWNKKAKIGLYMSFMVLKLMLCDSEEAPDFSEISDSGKGVLSFFDFATKATGTFETRIRDLVEFCIAKGYV
ncbi:unnamed protein product [Phaedon cochleariae]|uniref:Uncharacterized protein n=1 Tax=Phaedon cochleariae TaxID=80249 RepID=A0A9P0DTR8_PHACE|nr:unnamed protein product [Phaedon cochleariae]